MTLKKRGLGRGLEALLADEPVKEESQQVQILPVNEPAPAGVQLAPVMVEDVDDRADMVVALFKSIQRENLLLREEAEVLRGLIEEFEALIRADLSQSAGGLND
ncbi:MAG: hypothetical protein U1D70_14240 [Methylobacter sp.]|nr:hypothetical protein [Methylobacter sp.]MDP2430301.1 hypothetical protein [Methylobacter sp.]MDP3053470.1 hypothetical protein [Methylobacter sp.]MDP3362649.1 hypothetical protein [Methylobacter sp.]MDZ4220165.1 hypothetical protein [Methylobacter sp.]